MSILPSPTPRMIVEKTGPIGWMIFNNPDRLNAVSLDMWQAVPKIIASFEADSEIKTIVLKGAGDRAFVAGADISQFEAQRGDPASVVTYEDATTAAFDAIAKAERPTIAMIDGFCIGGGLGIALSCDLRFASVGSTFGIPAAKLGLAYAASGTRRLVDVVGPAFAKEIFFTARRFSHDEALAMGLINRVFAREALDAETQATCATIADNAPLTVMTAKKIVDETLKASDNFDAAMCEQLIERCFHSADYAEGRTAFMEKRKAVFKGK